MLFVFCSGFIHNSYGVSDELVEAQLRKMSLQEKVGQLFIFGVRGHQLSKSTIHLIQSQKPGAVVLFGHNIQSIPQLKKLTDQIQSLYEHTPPFIAIDQEGGRVSRIRMRPSFPSAYAIGATNNPDLAERIGFLTGSALRSLGFSMNFAPVVDVADDQKKCFIGSRAFGSKPDLVAMMASSYSKGLMMADVMPTAKHFPGHGSTTVDSHEELPIRKISYQALKVNDLVPFKRFFNLPGMTSVMLAHIAFPQLDSSLKPASFSRPIITGLLRKHMRYQGLVITDDFDMRSISEHSGKYSNKVIQSLRAGADMVMMAWSRRHQRRSNEMVLNAIQSGQIKESQINAKVRRILKAKNEYLRHGSSTPVSDAIEVLKSPYLTDSFYDVFRHNLVNQSEQLVGFLKPGETPQVVSGSWQFLTSFRKKSPRPVRGLLIQKGTSIKSLQSKWRRKKKSILFVTGPRSARIASLLPDHLRTNTLLVTATNPKEVSNSKGYAGILNFYSNHPQVGAGIASALFTQNKVVAEAQ